MNPNISMLDTLLKVMATHRDKRTKIFAELINYLRNSPEAQALSQVQLYNSYGLKCMISKDVVLSAYENLCSLGNSFIESSDMSSSDKSFCKLIYKQICDDSVRDHIRYLAQTDQLASSYN